MIKICILLNGPIINDSRVIKVIKTLSKKHIVHLFYMGGNSDDQNIFNENVKLFYYDFNRSLKTKLILHSFFWNEFNFLIKEVLKTKVQYHTIWANDFPTLYPSYKIASKLNAKLVYDAHEIYLETLNQFFPVNTSFFKSCLFNFSLFIMKTFGRHYEKKLIRKANRVITVNQSLADYFMKSYSISNIDVVMNLPYSSNKNSSSVKDFRKTFSFKKSDLLLIYQGVLNNGRGLELIIESINKTPKKIKLIILGDGFLKKRLIDLVATLKLESRVKFIDKVPIDELLNYTCGADIGINILEEFNLSKKLASPNKLFEYIHAEIPVVCSKTIENQKVLKKYQIGIMVDNDIVDISNKISNLIKEDFKDYKQACKLASQEYNWQKQEEKILSFICN